MNITNSEDYKKTIRQGAALYNKKEYAQALPCFQAGAAYNPTNYKLLETLTLIYLKLKRLPEAEESYNRACQLFNNKSATKLEMRSFEDAVSELKDIDELQADYEASKLNDDSPRIPVELSLQYMAHGDYKKAEELLLKHREDYFKAKQS